MGVSTALKAGLRRIAMAIGRKAGSFIIGVAGLSGDIGKNINEAGAKLIDDVVEAGRNADSLRKAFTDFIEKFDVIADSATPGQKTFLNALKRILDEDIAKALADLSAAGADAASSTKKGVFGKIQEGLDSPTTQKLLLGAGVFGGLMYISDQQDEIEEDRAACVAACLPSNWDEYQADSTVELNYTTSAELDALDLSGAPLCTAEKLESPGCYSYCYDTCAELNPSFLSRFIDPFSDAVTDVSSDLGEAAGAVASGAAGAAGAGAQSFFEGLGLPITLAIGVMILIVIVMIL